MPYRKRCGASTLIRQYCFCEATKSSNINLLRGGEKNRVSAEVPDPLPKLDKVTAMRDVACARNTTDGRSGCEILCDGLPSSPSCRRNDTAHYALRIDSSADDEGRSTTLERQTQDLREI